MSSNLYETPYGRLPSREARAILSEAQNHRCCYCGSEMIEPPVNSPYPYNPRHASIEHLTPVSRGGRNSFDNLAAACIDCNCRRPSDMLAIAWFYKRTNIVPVPIINSPLNKRGERLHPKLRPTPQTAAVMAENRAKALAQIEAQKKLREIHRQIESERRARESVLTCAPHGRPKDCNFDPAMRRVALVKPPPKRSEPPPLEMMSRGHRRRVKMHEKAIAPMQHA